MDDGFQFIIESPQNSTGHKKRPRLVTSCDNCRLKKIKCLQSAPETKCEACRTAKISCRFKDRERYFAERSRAIAGPPPYGDDASGRSSTNSPKPSGVVVPEGDSYYPSSVHRRSVDARRAPPPPAPHPAQNPSNGLGQQRGPHLFDPDRPQFPHSNYMSHFIAVFFEHLANDFQFLTYTDVSRAYWDQLLSPYLANAIAAMAARYSTHPDLVLRGVHNVADAYAENAKALFPNVAHMLTMDNLHATILIGWYEYKVNRLAGLRTYAQIAMRMAMDQGLTDETVADRLALGEAERQRRNLTWSGVYQLHMTTQSALPMSR